MTTLKFLPFILVLPVAMALMLPCEVKAQEAPSVPSTINTIKILDASSDLQMAIAIDAIVNHQETPSVQQQIVSYLQANHPQMIAIILENAEKNPNAVSLQKVAVAINAEISPVPIAEVSAQPANEENHGQAGELALPAYMQEYLNMTE